MAAMVLGVDQLRDADEAERAGDRQPEPGGAAALPPAGREAAATSPPRTTSA
ncbi:MAG TPA: hypothetical protein VG187_03485 [Mycobacterium sp.]|nr:hypothetical protein [Mycobacterium sp.]